MTKKNASTAPVLSHQQWETLIAHGEAMKESGTYTFKALQAWGKKKWGVEVKAGTYYTQRSRRGVTNGGKGE